VRSRPKKGLRVSRLEIGATWCFRSAQMMPQVGGTAV